MRGAGEREGDEVARELHITSRIPTAIIACIACHRHHLAGRSYNH